MRDELNAMAGPLLVEFGAPWCPYCQLVQPTLAKLLARYPNVTHLKIYDWRRKPLGRSFRVKLWPNLVFLRNGRVLKQLARPSDDEMLDAFQAIASECNS